MDITEFITEIELDEAKKKKKHAKASKKKSTMGKKKAHQYREIKKKTGSESLAVRSVLGDDKQKAIASKTIKQLIGNAASLAFSDIDKIIHKHGLQNIKKELGEEDVLTTKISIIDLEECFDILLDEESKVIDKYEITNMLESTLSKKTFFTRYFGSFNRTTPGSKGFEKAWKLEDKKNLKKEELKFYIKEKENAFVNTLRNYLGGAFFFYAFSGFGDDLILAIRKYDKIKKQDVFNFINSTFSRFLILSPQKKLFGDVLRSKENTIKMKIRDLFFDESGNKKTDINQIKTEANSIFKGLTKGKLFFKPNEFFSKKLKEKEEKIASAERSTFKKKMGVAYDEVIPGNVMAKFNVDLGLDQINIFPDAKILGLMDNATPEQRKIFKKLASVEMKTGKFSITSPTVKSLTDKGILIDNKINFMKLRQNLNMFGLPKRESTIYLQMSDKPDEFIKIFKSNRGHLISKSMDKMVKISDIKYKVGDKKTGYKTFDLTQKGNKIGFNITDKQKDFLWKNRPEITLTQADFSKKIALLKKITAFKDKAIFGVKRIKDSIKKNATTK